MEQKKFNISTTLHTLSKVKEILGALKIENIPVFNDDMEALREYICTEIILNLSDEPKRLNALLRSITNSTDEDFTTFGFEQIFDILTDFFVSTGDKLISWKKMRSIELKSQESTDLPSMIEMMTKNPKIAEMISSGLGDIQKP